MPSADVRDWFSLEDAALAGDPAMPTTVRGWAKIAEAEGWRHRAGRAKREGKGWVYHLSLFPPSTQVRLLLKSRAAIAETAERSATQELWRNYEALPEKHKLACLDRLKSVKYAKSLMEAGLTLVAAVALAAGDAGVSPSTVRNWLNAVNGQNRADWLAALAPGYRPTAVFAECHDGAWAVLKADYLRPEAPGFSACYRRMKSAAVRNGWEPIPSEMALRRRLEAEVPRSVMIIRREGGDRAKALFPAQRRTRRGEHAMSLVNIDGHKFDVLVKRPPHSETIYLREKGEAKEPKPFRPILVAIQDIYSGKFLSWRLDESESNIPVRLAIGDMVETYGIPEAMILDNGRAFASKDITGGTGNRYRFKVRDDDPDGLLTTLGVEVHWAKPHHGQSKPIERAFRDLCEEIAKHPFCAGAYTGNSPVNKPDNYGSRAIEWDAFKGFVDAMIAEHNARPGRTTETTRGQSFDAAFAASLAAPQTVVKWATAEQRDLWALMVEGQTARKGNGEIHLMGNRYWSPAMVQLAGRKVHVRFDPDDLSKPVKVYDLKGRLLTTAEVQGVEHYRDVSAAKRQAQRVADYRKAQKKLSDMHVTMSVDELGRIHAPAPLTPATPQRPAVTRLATRGNAALKAAPDQWNQEHEDGLGAVVDMLSARTARRGG